MAKKSGLGQRMYVGGFDVSGDLGAISNASSPRGVQDVTGLDKDAFERLLLLAGGMLSFATFFNDATDQLHDALSTLPTTDRIALWLTGIVRGDPVACLNAKQINYDWNRNPNGSLVGAVELQGQGSPLEWGELLVAKTTHASATDEATLDNGASSPDGAVGYLEHFSGASGTIEYDIEDSADNAVFANLIAFTDVPTPYTQQAQRVVVAGTVDRYVRASTNGVFTNAVFAMALRRRVTGEIHDD